MFNMRFPEGKLKVVTLSYDDGLYDDIQLMELMAKYGVRGTFNVSSGLYREEGKPVEGPWPRLTLSEALANYPRFDNEIAVHGIVHRNFPDLSDAELYYEISADKALLEQQYGMVVRGCAYPYGGYNAKAMEALKNCGIKYARTCGHTPDFRIPANWYEWGATCHHCYEGLMDYAERFVTEEFKDCRMLYVWGHAAEFRRDKNWDMMEKFLAKVGNREDIWYATNIEIVEYVNAYRSLEYSSAPKTDMVYNPTAKEIWLERYGKVFSVKPGETVKL